jgi:hypothetical protein
VGPAFYKRFGIKPFDAVKNQEEMRENVHLDERRWDRLTYGEVSPVHLKPCPNSNRGIDWEDWLLSIQGGDVVAVKTVFQELLRLGLSDLRLMIWPL